MPDLNDAIDEMLRHSEDDGEWLETPEHIEIRPSGFQVISVRLPTALAEKLIAEAESRGLKFSVLVRLAVERLLRPEEHPISALTPALSIPADQAWFWTQEWQTRVAKAEADRVAGNSTVYSSEEEFLAALDGE